MISIENSSDMGGLLQQMDNEIIDKAIEAWMEDLSATRIDKVLPYLIYEKQRRLELWED